MEGLTKQQLTLLALLVSFVTSMATGIVTVALMQHAPPAITQTINRVVERTVERVVPATADTQKAAIVTKETVVVRSDDLAVAAIEKNTKSIVRIKRVEGAGDKREEKLVGLGFILSKNGAVVADISVLARHFDDYGTPIPRSFLGTLFDNSVVELRVVGYDDTAGVSLLTVQPTEGGALPDLLPATLGNSDQLKLGQTVISLGGETDNAVATGIIANLERKDAPLQTVEAITTDREAASTLSGTVLMNLSGDIIGMNAGMSRTERARYLPANLLTAGIENIKKASAP